MEPRELEETAQRYGDSIYRAALHMTAQPSDAEDVLQEVLLERYQTKQTFQTAEHERRWLLRVAVNKSHNVLRFRRRHQTVPLEEAWAMNAPSEPDYRPLYDAVRTLPYNHRITLDLYYYEGYSTEEIAELVGVRPATVRTWLRRARGKLKVQLKEGWDDE